MYGLNEWARRCSCSSAAGWASRANYVLALLLLYLASDGINPCVSRGIEQDHNRLDGATTQTIHRTYVFRPTNGVSPDPYIFSVMVMRACVSSRTAACMYSVYTFGLSKHACTGSAPAPPPAPLTPQPAQRTALPPVVDVGVVGELAPPLQQQQPMERRQWAFVEVANGTEVKHAAPAMNNTAFRLEGGTHLAFAHRNVLAASSEVFAAMFRFGGDDTAVVRYQPATHAIALARCHNPDAFYQATVTYTHSFNMCTYLYVVVSRSPFTRATY
jgi:hypothetical protein